MKLFILLWDWFFYGLLTDSSNWCNYVGRWVISFLHCFCHPGKWLVVNNASVIDHIDFQNPTLYFIICSPFEMYSLFKDLTTLQSTAKTIRHQDIFFFMWMQWAWKAQEHVYGFKELCLRLRRKSGSSSIQNFDFYFNNIFNKLKLQERVFMLLVLSSTNYDWLLLSICSSNTVWGSLSSPQKERQDLLATPFMGPELGNGSTYAPILQIPLHIFQGFLSIHPPMPFLCQAVN